MKSVRFGLVAALLSGIAPCFPATAQDPADAKAAATEAKMTDVERFEMTPHPVEFEMYYSS